jgi:eukaryotic-like serine/threonine-protein kinase
LLDERYQLGPLVGRGGMATVHSATDVRLRRSVAVKLFHPPVDEIALARLTAEARLLAGLSHPGLVKVFDVCMESDQPYLVMQLIGGSTLRTVINRGVLEPAVVARLGARLAETLRYVHSRDVVHRDIKPSNVLLDDNGACYLADFGIAKAAGAAHLTATGHCVGTAAYLAPEQVSGIGAGPPADIYSLGLVLLECLTGEPEFTGTEVEAAVARLTRSPEVPRWIPPSLRRALVAMTAREPRDRPAAAECVTLFENYLDNPAPDSGELPTVAVEPVDPPTKTLEVPAPTMRMRPVRAAGAFGVLSLVIAGAVLLSNDTGAGAGQSEDQQPAAPVVVPVVAVVTETAAGQVVVVSQQQNQPQQQQQQQRPPAPPPEQPRGGGPGKKPAPQKPGKGPG